MRFPLKVRSSTWKLGEALALIKSIQTRIKKLGFHVCLAGGVLNVGYSQKDLDLVFLPLWNDKQPPVEPLLTYLYIALGQPKEGEEETSHKPNPFTPYRHQEGLYDEGKRIDIFIV